jgi:hypothetical protein
MRLFMFLKRSSLKTNCNPLRLAGYGARFSVPPPRQFEQVAAGFPGVSFPEIPLQDHNSQRAASGDQTALAPTMADAPVSGPNIFRALE